MHHLLESVPGPQCPVIQVAAWLTFFDKFACIKDSVVALKPEMGIGLPARFRARAVPDEARITLSCRNDQKSRHGIPPKSTVDRPSACWNFRPPSLVDTRALTFAALT